MRGMTLTPLDEAPLRTFDSIDESIVALLGEDGRLGYEELARRLDLPRAKIRARTKDLLESGAVVVRGTVHPSIFGLESAAHVMIGCNGPAEAVALRIAEFAEVVLVSLVSGRRPIVAEVRAASHHALADVLRRIGSIEQVHSVESALYLDILEGASRPVSSADDIGIDDVDRRLLRILQLDGRRSFADLADDVGLSIAAARARVLRLIADRLVIVEGRVPPSALGEAQIGVGITLLGPHEPAIAALRASSDVHYLATALGRWTAIGTVHAGRRVPEWQILDRIRSIEGVASVESWRHLHFVKEQYSSGEDGASL